MKKEFFEEMNKNTENENFTADLLYDQSIQAILDDTYNSLEILTDQERTDLQLKQWSLSMQEKAILNQEMLLFKDINSYISSLKLPCYDSIKYYYYYDILEALSRNLFQQLIDKAREELNKQEFGSTSSKASG